MHEHRSAPGTLIGFLLGIVNGIINTLHLPAAQVFFETIVLATTGALVGLITTAIWKRTFRKKL